jgi:hypothetical protein
MEVIGKPEGFSREITTPRGNIISVWQSNVPRIADEILNCVFYLYPDVPTAQDGGKMGGTGFFVGIPIEDFPHVCRLYAVTNRHNIDHGHTVIRLNTKDGKTDPLDLTEQDWVNHPEGDDLAIAKLGRLDYSVYDFTYIAPEHFLTKEIVSKFDIGPGDEAFMVGRFVNADGKARNHPSVRFGNIAQIGGDPLIYERGSKYVHQESIIVEGRSIPGYSGSPVFAHIPPMTARPGVGSLHAASYGPWLLGVDYCHLNDLSPAENAMGVEMQFKIRVNSGMMGVVPAWRLMEFLNMPNFYNDRESIRQHMKKIPPATMPTVALDSSASAPPANDENPTHREDFMRLVGAAAQKPPQEG